MTDKDFDRWPKIHYTQVPAPTADCDREMHTFRRELPRLLAEGNEGKWALIKGDEIIGVYDTIEDADRAGVAERYILAPVREWQPMLRMRRPEGLTALFGLFVVRNAA
jgi:hypothetical protein